MFNASRYGSRIPEPSAGFTPGLQGTIPGAKAGGSVKQEASQGPGPERGAEGPWGPGGEAWGRGAPKARACPGMKGPGAGLCGRGQDGNPSAG